MSKGSPKKKDNVFPCDACSIDGEIDKGTWWSETFICEDCSDPVSLFPGNKEKRVAA